jgi:hypothetical protein
MLLIDKENVRKDITAIKEKLANPERKTECIANIKKLIDMKQSHIWRADAGSCGRNVCGLVVPLLEIEIETLQRALNAVKENDSDKAAALLEDYLAFLEKNYGDEALITSSLRLGGS